jgi:HlyD family secretion protein
MSCTAIGGNGSKATQQSVEVVSGDLTVTVSGSGTIEVSRKLSLSFGGNGRIDKIFVEEGDNVSAGKVLAKLDTGALDLSYSQAQVPVTQSEILLKQAEIAQQTAEYDLKNTRDLEGALQLALLDAQIDLEQAQRNLSTGIAAVDYQAIEAELRKAKTWYDHVEDSLQEATGDAADDWLLALDRAEERLKVAQANYDNSLAGYNSQEITIKKQQVASAEMALAQAQQDLDDLAEDIAAQELQVASAKLSVENARQSLELACQSQQEAQRQLDEAVIIAPFDGVVTSVGAEEGDTVTPENVIICLIDPTSKELVADIDETDVIKVTIGQRAIIEADALPNHLLEGKVSYVAPVARNSAGLMLYKVKIQLSVLDGSHLRVGMSASADIVIEERADVLLVPNRAIKQDGQGNQIVEVMAGEKVQERQVVTGISDGLQTEILSGLDEGEIVVR